ncbi:MAG: tetratricopeptide repeat protein, partial [Planctomycetota bacterium]
MSNQMLIVKRVRLCLTTMLLILLLGGAAWARGWTWELPGQRYKGLNQFERSLYDKAANAFRGKHFRQAASLFEKFKIQFPESSELGYVVFMRGYSLHQDRKRHTAVKVYQECLDYFGDDVEIASVSLYFMGIAHLEIGSKKDGLECMQELAEDEELNKHPLVAGALLRLADNYGKNNEPVKRIEKLKQVVRDFSKKSPSEASTARDGVTAYYVKLMDYAGYTTWLVNAENKDNVRHMLWVYENAWNAAHNGYRHWWRKEYQLKKKEKAKAVKAFLTFFAQSQSWYAKAKRDWNYLEKLVSFVSANVGGVERDNTIDQALAFIGKTWKDDAKTANGKYAWVSDRLAEISQWPKAKYCLTKITDTLYRTWKEQELLQRQKKYADAAAKVQELIKSGDKAWVGKAESTWAGLYHRHLGKYDEAIKIYQQLNKPPSTLWNIQDCYYRKGSMQKALATLTEIENFFKKDAPNAAFQKATYY